MKTKLVILFFLSTIGTSFAQYYNQYFDGADTSIWNSLIVQIDASPANIWQIGKPQKLIFDSASSTPNVIVTDTVNPYPNNNTSSFTLNIVPWGTHGILGIQWKQKLDMDKKKDGGMIDFSVDYGATWQSAFNNPHVYNIFGYPAASFDTLLTGEYAFSGTDSLWQDVWLCYDMMWITAMVDTIKIRYTFISDSINNNKEGWMIDNMNAHVTMAHPVKENATNDYFNVFPNPAKGVVNIELQRVNEFHIIENMQLINAEGKLLQEWNTIPTRYWIDVSKYPNGNYFLKIKSNLKSKTIPISIQN